MSEQQNKRLATFSHEDSEVGHLYYFEISDRSAPPYKNQRHVKAILDIADDGTLAGVELIDDMPPPPSTNPAGEVTQPAGVRVKGLEWVQVIPGRLAADIYVVERVYLDEWCWRISADKIGAMSKVVAGHLSLEQGKSAAQNHYDARILSALEPQQEEPAQTETTLYALHHAKGALENLFEVMNEQGAASDAEDDIFNEACGVIERALALPTIQQPVAITDEMVSIPRKPTDDMCQAFEDEYVAIFGGAPPSPWSKAEQLYSAMITAALVKP